MMPTDHRSSFCFQTSDLETAGCFGWSSPRWSSHWVRSDRTSGKLVVNPLWHAVGLVVWTRPWDKSWAKLRKE
jgi:hypothetical protein